MSQVIQIPEQQVYLLKLLGYDYTIHYKPGSTNVVVDALSRISVTQTLHLLLSVPHSLFMEQLRQACQENSSYQELFRQVQLHPEDHPSITIK